MVKRVVVTSPLPGDAVAELGRRFELEQCVRHQPRDEAGLIELISSADAVLTLLEDSVTRGVLDACPHLKVVANCAVGFDNVDVEAARERGVWVTNTPDVLTGATADLTLALILAVTRRVVEADTFLRAGRFERWAPDLLLGSGLEGKTLGIVGLGRIGSAVARRAAAFGMRVVYTGRQPRDERAAALGVEPAPVFLPLDQLLEQADVVSLHCPLTAQTRHLLDARRLRKMRPGATLINTSRGPLIDEDALVTALEQGVLAGAGLDVYEHEPRVDPGLLERKDVVLLPHIGSATLETRAAMAGLAVRCIIDVLEGREPPTPVVRGRLDRREPASGPG